MAVAERNSGQRIWPRPTGRTSETGCALARPNFRERPGRSVPEAVAPTEAPAAPRHPDHRRGHCRTTKGLAAAEDRTVKTRMPNVEIRMSKQARMTKPEEPRRTFSSF